MAEALIEELVRMENNRENDRPRVGRIRTALRTLGDQLAKLQGFYSGLSMFLHLK